MLEILEGLPAGVAGLKAIGKVTDEDYTQVFEPMLDEARREGRSLRRLYQFGPEFEGFDAKARELLFGTGQYARR